MYKRNAQGWLKHIDFILLDMLCLLISFLSAYLIRYGLVYHYSNYVYKSFVFFIELADLVVLFFCSTLHNVLKRGYYRELKATGIHAVLLLFLVTAYLYTMKTGALYSRMVVYMTVGFYMVLTYIVRILWKQVILRTKLGRKEKALLILTTEEYAPEAVEAVKGDSYEAFSIAGLALVGAKAGHAPVSGVEKIMDENSIFEFITKEWVDEILAVFPAGYPMPVALLNRIVDSGITLHIELPMFKEITAETKNIEKVGPYNVMTASINTATPKELLAKRLLDIVGGLVGCFFTLILILFIGPKIKKESPGPIFFAQERVGQNGKKFRMYKFRSMYLDAEERKKELMAQNTMSNDLMFKMDWDPRIIGNKIVDGKKTTGIGDLIRRTSLDEFPQFWNVLKGDMSLVGTRPPTVDEVEKYNLHHRARLAIKPGITGMWQVSGRSDITDFEEVVELDTKYIREWSFGLDLKILFETVAAVVKHKGAK